MEDIANIQTYIIYRIVCHLMAMTVVPKVIPVTKTCFVIYKSLEISIPNFEPLTSESVCLVSDIERF